MSWVRGDAVRCGAGDYSFMLFHGVAGSVLKSLLGEDMSIEACRECGGKVSSEAVTCLHCGVALRLGAGGAIKRILLWGIGGLVGLVVLIMLFGPSPDPEKYRRKDAIDLCWKEQGRKSLEAGAGRFVAGACEMMEREFEEKYGRKP